MDDYIKREDAIRCLQFADSDVCQEWLDGYVAFGLSRSLINEMLQRLPAVDIVQVVRCKDCLRFKLNMENDPYCSHRDGLSGPTPNDFCSYGERKGNADGRLHHIM